MKRSRTIVAEGAIDGVENCDTVEEVTALYEKHQLQQGSRFESTTDLSQSQEYYDNENKHD